MYQCISIDKDRDTDTGLGTFWTWLISSVIINVAFDGEFMIAPLLANDKGTHTSSCVSIANGIGAHTQVHV